MRIPSATYRVQFNLNFRFTDAENLVPYLHELGISHLYSSPGAQARRGSLHGYDVADPLRINSEIGTPEEFSRLVERLQKYGMGLLLDIVPNHMVASPENPWWMDVLENGRESTYGSYFDIDWQSPGSKCSGLQKDRVVLPILADLYERVLVNQGIRLRLDEKGFYVQAEGNRVPVSPKTYPMILESCIKILGNLGVPDAAIRRFSELLGDSSPHAVQRPPVPSSDTGPLQPGPLFGAELKGRLWQLYLESPEIHQAIDETLGNFNGVKGESGSFESLDSLLSMQAYRLAFWRNAGEEINYRRFFGLNELVTLRVEDRAVFEATHAPVFQLVAEGKIDGLRVDHIDGLRDPLDYLQRLQEEARPRTQEGDSNELNMYTIVEKITSGSESIPAGWPVAGTTGYDFLNAVNTLFIDPAGSRDLETKYREFTGIRSSFSDTWYLRKKQVMEELFASDIRTLSCRLGRLAVIDRLGRDIPMRELTRGLKEITACLAIYRTYARSLELSHSDRLYLERAFRVARDRTPVSTVSEDAFSFLRRVFLLEPSASAASHPDEWTDFLLRWQQFTGAVMAKGLEDTAFFVHHGLISLNEVGCTPLRKEIRFGVAAFHQYNRKTFGEHPYTLNATSTHDTKWSEDVRARINVLSECPEDWRACLGRWAELNSSKKTIIDERAVPSPNEEVLLYQSMLGVWPLEEGDSSGLKERIQAFILKAAREAKTHSSWVSPNEAHEQALQNFIAAITGTQAENPFLTDFFAFLRRIARYGACNGYSQLLLKMTSPGIPDLFQGNELWNLRLTDPDNRNPVDFEKRVSALDELRLLNLGSSSPNPTDLTNSWKDGRLKLFLARQVLNFRRSHRDLFLKGDYVPLEAAGEQRESVCSFMRRHEDTWAIVVVPRLVSRVAGPETFPLGPTVWRSSVLRLPAHPPATWKNIFTGGILTSSAGRKKTLPLAEIFSQLPFALLVHDRESAA